MTDFKNITKLWKQYNEISKKLTEAMNSSTNEVGEFAERLVAECYNAEKYPTSHKGADLITPKKVSIQVKSRKLAKVKSTNLGIIRSWDFDILVVVIFSTDGGILKAIEIKKDDAKALSKPNKHQNGYTLATNKELLEHQNAKDITTKLRELLKRE